MQALVAERTGRILVLDRKSLTVAIEGTKSSETEFKQPAPARIVFSEDALQEVPHESLEPKKGFNAKSIHKELRKKALLRLGGIIGTKDGSIGTLVYGSYLEKDKIIMDSIGSTNYMAAEISESLRTSAKETMDSIGSTNYMAVEVSETLRTSAKETMDATNHLAAAVFESTKMPSEKDFASRVPLITAIPANIELPDYIIGSKAKFCGHHGHKSKMAEAMLRLGGIYCDNDADGLGSIVYGSFSSDKRLEY